MTMREVMRTEEDMRVLSCLASRLDPHCNDFVQWKFDHPYIRGEGGLSVLVGEVGGRWGCKLLKNLACPKMTKRVRRRAEREFNGLMYLQHKVPRIPQVGQPVLDPNTDEVIGYELEILDGKPINEWQLDLEEQLYLTLLLLDSLGHMHNHKVVHRDVKPGNLLVDKEDGILGLSVVDFNTLRADELFAERLTPEGTLVGTLKYMSPEVAAGHEPDHRSDLYGVAAVLYEQISGEAPAIARKRIHGGHMYGDKYFVANEDYPLPRIRGADDELIRVLERGLARHPEQRFQSAKEMHNALAVFMNQNNLFPQEVIEVHQQSVRNELLRNYTERLIHSLSSNDPTNSRVEMQDRVIFQSLEFDSELVVLKPDDGILRSSQLNHQFRILQALNGVDCAPRVMRRYRFDKSVYALQKEFFPLVPSLSEWLDEYRVILKSLSEDDKELIVVGIFIKIIEAVGEIHEQGVVHGNLTPDTIHAAYSNTEESAKLRVFIDGFHSARWVNRANSVAYQVDGDASFVEPCLTVPDLKQDIFSLGKCLHAALAHFYLDPQDSLEEWLQQSPFENLCRFGSAEGLCRIIEKATQDSPTMRYQSTDEMIDDLMSFVAEETLPVAQVM